MKLGRELAFRHMGQRVASQLSSGFSKPRKQQLLPAPQKCHPASRGATGLKGSQGPRVDSVLMGVCMEQTPPPKGPWTSS